MLRALTLRHTRGGAKVARQFASLPPSLDTSESSPKSTIPYNRWATVPPSMIVEMSIGSIYCWTMWNLPITQSIGIITAAPLDFSVSEVIPVFSLAAGSLGIATGFLGKWVEKSGPRKAGTIGAAAWCASLCTAALGVELHSLPLIYTGYGLFGGISWGILYMSPVSSVMKHFPDKRGLATGLTLSAFGLGAAIAPPIIEGATQFFFEAPTYLGDYEVLKASIETLADGSMQYTPDSSSSSLDVVVATPAEAARYGPDVLGGVYELGTGNSGASKALASLGFAYGAVGAAAAQFTRAPPKGWVPEGFVADQTSTAGSAIGLPEPAAVRTKQFPLLWMTIFGNATGGLALISASKLMITDIWAGALPLVVTSTFATGYVAAVGSANAAGRLSWAVLSDKLGRKNTYMLFGTAMPIIGGGPTLISMGMGMDPTSGAAVLPLSIFYGGSLLAISYYGGLFSVLPAYIADLYGQKHAGAIHGTALTAWSGSAVCGPLGLVYLRDKSTTSAIDDLLSHADPARFEEQFGAPISNVQALIDSKTVTINKLMTIMPEGVADPTPYLYDTTCYVAVGLLGLAFCSNAMLTPPDVPRLLEELEAKEQKEREEEKEEEKEKEKEKGRKKKN